MKTLCAARKAWAKVGLGLLLVACGREVPEAEGVEARVLSVHVTPPTLALEVGTTVKLEAKVRGKGDFDRSLLWESSDPSVATVRGGEVAGLGEGEATITATSNADPTKVGSAAVTVVAAPTRPARLRITIEGLPEAVDAGVWVDGRGSLWEVVDESRTFEDLAPGTYFIYATERTVGDETYFPMLRRSEVVVRSGETTEVVVEFVAGSELMVRLVAASSPLPHLGRAEMLVTIHRRDGFDAPVTIAAEGVPEGVTAVEVRAEAGEEQVALHLESDGTHPVIGRHPVEVVARTDELLFRGEATIDLRPVVTSLSDSGPGTLRHYVDLAPKLETTFVFLSNPPQRVIPISFDPSLGDEVSIRLESPLVFREGVDPEFLTIIEILGAQRDGEPLVTIEGDGSRQLMVVESGGRLSLGNLILRGGNASRGGAIANAGFLRVVHSRFEENVAEAGGAIENTGGLSLENVSFLDNAADAGGAILNFGWVDAKNTHFEGNLASEAGGALDNQGRLFIVDSSLAANRAGKGGALQVGAGSESTLILRVLFENNEAEYGGGAHCEGPFSVSASSFVKNHASAEGGGLHVLTSGAEDFFAQVLNSTFAQNVSEGPGGGVFIAGDGRFELRHGTLAGNEATEGGGLFNQAELEIAATLLSENDSASGGDLHTVSGVVSEGYNLFGVLSGTEFPLAGSDSVGVDALIGELGDHGGQTPTIPLLPGSPAIDAIPPAQCLDLLGDRLSRDQRERLRPAGAGCDIGAFEVQ